MIKYQAARLSGQSKQSVNWFLHARGQCIYRLRAFFVTQKMLLAIIICSTISITLSNTKGASQNGQRGSKNWPLYITNEVETTYTPYSEWFLMVYIDQMSSFVVSFFKISIICQLDTRMQPPCKLKHLTRTYIFGQSKVCWQNF